MAEGRANSPPVAAGILPIGAVIAWLKSFSGMTTLASQGRNEYVECNGQTLSDASSPIFNTKVIPNLNGSASTKRFLRGSTTSGTTGGTDTNTSGDCLNCACCNVSQLSSDVSVLIPGTSISLNSFSILPSYYEVVWLLRVK